MTDQKKTGNRLKVFLPNVRQLTDKEIQNLPEQKRMAVDSESGIWVEVACPGGSCLTIGGKVKIESKDYVSEKKKGLWLNIFCPENRCEFDEPTDVP